MVYQSKASNLIYNSDPWSNLPYLLLFQIILKRSALWIQNSRQSVFEMKIYKEFIHLNGVFVLRLSLLHISLSFSSFNSKAGRKQSRNHVLEDSYSQLKNNMDFKFLMRLWKISMTLATIMTIFLSNTDIKIKCGLHEGQRTLWNPVKCGKMFLIISRQTFFVETKLNNFFSKIISFRLPFFVIDIGIGMCEAFIWELKINCWLL